MNRFNRIIQVPSKLYSSSMGGWIFGIIRKGLAKILYKLIRWYYHCDIPYSLNVSGCYFCHNGFGVVINPRTKLGEHVEIQHSVTIGSIGTKTPVIGNHVYIGAKAIIIGGVKISDNAKIGAGAVVINDVPEGCTAVGVPAKVIRHNNGEEITKVNPN